MAVVGFLPVRVRLNLRPVTGNPALGQRGATVVEYDIRGRSNLLLLPPLATYTSQHTQRSYRQGSTGVSDYVNWVTKGNVTRRIPPNSWVVAAMQTASHIILQSL